jgi:hypothetical protein
MQSEVKDKRKNKAGRENGTKGHKEDEVKEIEKSETEKEENSRATKEQENMEEKAGVWRTKPKRQRRNMERSSRTAK